MLLGNDGDFRGQTIVFKMSLLINVVGLDTEVTADVNCGEIRLEIITLRFTRSYYTVLMSLSMQKNNFYYSFSETDKCF